MKTIIILVFFFSLLNPKNHSNDLFGTWECYHKELEDGTTKSTDFDGNEFEYTCEGLIELKIRFHRF